VIVFLNGAFGIGKTTVARRLRRALPASVICDPEKVGFVIQRLGRLLPLSGADGDDFQHIPAWRRLTQAHIRACRALRPIVLVPMAITEPAYLEQLRSGALKIDPDVRHLCLVAPLETVQARLAGRVARSASDAAWQMRRAAECCSAHGHPRFAEQVDTAGATPDEVTDAILARLAGR
jgi:hypothetical protein